MGAGKNPAALAALLAGMLAASMGAQAAGVDTGARRALNQVAVEFGGLHQHYTEWARGFGNPSLPDPLDREDGSIGLLRFAAQAYDPQFYGLWGEVRYDFASGDTTYTGHTQSLAPLDTTTDNTVHDVRARIGYPVELAYGVAAVPFVEGGYFRWDRAVAGGTSAAIEELYADGYTGGGVKLLYSPANALTLSVTADGGSTLYGGMSVLSPFAADVDLGDHAYAGASAQADYRLTGRWHAIARISYRYFGYGISDPVVATIGGAPSLVREPNSTTEQVRAAFGLAYDF